MDLTPDFRNVVSKDGESIFSSESPAVKFPMDGHTPVVAIDFDGTLAEYKAGGDPEKLGKPIRHAIWALRTFKFNGWEVEIFTLRGRVEPVWVWVDKYSTGLVDRINESRMVPGSDLNSCKPLADLFIDDRDEYWFGRNIDWIEIMVRLYRKGLLEQGLLPLKLGVVEGNNMIASFNEPIFQGIVSDLRNGVEADDESREDLIKSAERYVKHPGLLNTTGDILLRAKVAGNLLECVLKLMVMDRFDPVGCMILAQQGRELDSEMPSLLEDDLD